MFVTTVSCFRCGRETAATGDDYLCTVCGPGADGEDPGVLDVRYDYPAAAAALEWLRRGRSTRTDVFRYLPLLPVGAAVDSLPAGGTPLVPAPRLARRLGIGALYLKDETRNPTRCLKDRATAVAVARALESGRSELYCASAGNAAISLAGFCAHQELGCHVFVPAEASRTRLEWLERYGAEVRVSTGNYDQAFDEAEAAGREHGWYSRNCAFNPYLVEGKKTVSFEIAEQLGWTAPDLVVAPVGDGCTLGAIGKGFRELREVGLTDEIPRLLGVQSEAVQPLVERFSGSRAEHAAASTAAASTAAASIAVRRPRNALRLLGELRESAGTMLAVDDAAISIAQDALAREAGVVAEFTSAATLAGIARLAEGEDLSGRTVVLVITGGRPDEA